MYLLGQLNLARSITIIFEQSIAHGFVASIVIVIEMKRLASTGQIIKLAACLSLQIDYISVQS
jgi:hypothetical protein